MHSLWTALLGLRSQMLLTIRKNLMKLFAVSAHRCLKILEMAKWSDVTAKTAQRAGMTDSHPIDTSTEQEADPKLRH